jgi:transposase
MIGMHYNQVGLWRRRFVDLGLGGLADGDRSGRPHVYDHDDVLLLVKTVTESPPDEASRWTMDTLARRMNEHGVAISASQVWRICRSLDLKPWQTESWMTSHDPDFWEKAADVCGLYLNPPENAVVWSVDEKTGIQAKSRVNPTLPPVPGVPTRREFEYRRHGTVVLFAGLNVHQGNIEGWVTDSARSENFVEFLTHLIEITPRRRQLHCIVDNLATHTTDKVHKLVNKHRGRVVLHFTPTHASWLNQVELFFSILERRMLKHGEAHSQGDLANKIMAFIAAYNHQAAPFAWTYDGRPLKIA